MSAAADIFRLDYSSISKLLGTYQLKPWGTYQPILLAGLCNRNEVVCFLVLAIAAIQRFFVCLHEGKLRVQVGMSIAALSSNVGHCRLPQSTQPDLAGKSYVQEAVQLLVFLAVGMLAAVLGGTGCFVHAKCLTMLTVRLY